MNTVRLALVRLGTFAVDLAQSIVSVFGGGNGDPMRVQGVAEPRQGKPQKRAGRSHR